MSQGFFDAPGTFKVPGSFVPHDTAVSRVASYKNGKHIVLCNWLQHIHSNPENGCWNFTVDSFVQFLKLLSGINNVDGVRVYYGSYDADCVLGRQNCPVGQEDMMVLIFAPTFYDGKDSNGNDLHRDTGVYYTIDPVNPNHPLTVATASAWVSYFRDDKIYLLERDGMRTNPDFKETTSIWYGIQALTDWIGLLHFAFNSTPGEGFRLHNLSGVRISLAVYQMAEKYPNQFGLIISLLEEVNGETKVINLECYFGFRNKLALILNNQDYDTGSPCPPDPNSCVGAGLPQ